MYVTLRIYLPIGINRYSIQMFLCRNYKLKEIRYDIQSVSVVGILASHGACAGEDGGLLGVVDVGMGNRLGRIEVHVVLNAEPGFSRQNIRFHQMLSQFGSYRCPILWFLPTLLSHPTPISWV